MYQLNLCRIRCPMHRNFFDIFLFLFCNKSLLSGHTRCFYSISLHVNCQPSQSGRHRSILSHFYVNTLFAAVFLRQKKINKILKFSSFCCIPKKAILLIAYPATPLYKHLQANMLRMPALFMFVFHT